MTQTNLQPKVYSYIRFSTPEQELGDSERRQMMQAEAFAKEKGLVLDKTLCMADKGISGFHGKHRKRGALGEFLARVDAGHVPPGSVLAVENIDRLGRENVIDALQGVIFTLLKKQIVIQTLKPMDTYSTDEIKKGAIWKLIAHVERAHAESQRRSDLLTAAWDNKRELAAKGIKLTKQVPCWLKVLEDNGGKRFEPIPEAVHAIRSIFKMKLGGMGRNAIARKLNESAGWAPPQKPKRESGGWRASYVTKLLGFRALIGEFQPYSKHPPRSERGGPTADADQKRKPVGDLIPDYYPAIIKPEVFHAVQKQLAANKGAGGETGKATNVLRHLAKCAYCGGSMVLIDKGPLPKGGRYLMCDIGRRGVRDDVGHPKCKAHAIRYEEAEHAIIDNCLGLRPEQVLPDPGAQAGKINDLKTRLDGIDGELAAYERGIENYLNGMEGATLPATRDRLHARIADLERKVSDAKTRRDEAARALEEAERDRTSVTAWKRDLRGLRDALANGDPETRLRMRQHLAGLIDKIEIFAVGFTRLRTRGDLERLRLPRRAVRKRRGNRRIELPADAPMEDAEDLVYRIEEINADADKPIAAADFKGFCNWATARRMSKHGRFIRIKFKTGLRRDIVPGDSIASGRGLELDDEGQPGWCIKQPSPDKLLQQYRSYTRHLVKPATT